MNWKFWSKQPKQQPDGWTDVLNPHGDNTLRPGDPIYDAVMKGNGGAVIGNFRDGKWDIKEVER